MSNRIFFNLHKIILPNSTTLLQNTPIKWSFASQHKLVPLSQIQSIDLEREADNHKIVFTFANEKDNKFLTARYVSSSDAINKYNEIINTIKKNKKTNTVIEI
jgi:hypothetical protein